jgi:hypothetical protein
MLFKYSNAAIESKWSSIINFITRNHLS